MHEAELQFDFGAHVNTVFSQKNCVYLAYELHKMSNLPMLSFCSTYRDRTLQLAHAMILLPGERRVLDVFGTHDLDTYLEEWSDECETRLVAIRCDDEQVIQIGELLSRDRKIFTCDTPFPYGECSCDDYDADEECTVHLDYEDVWVDPMPYAQRMFAMLIDAGLIGKGRFAA